MGSPIFLEKVKSEGLSHLSYILGQGGQAAVIDPRRDFNLYIHIAQQNNARITHIFETHRNEDYVIGSRGLARKTGAAVYHGKDLDFAYGHPVSEGDTFEIGNLKIAILETPGHTLESISLVVKDSSFGDQPIAVFTGDLLFIGSVGRTDLLPDRVAEVAGMQYDSIFNKILPLGDQVILFPAHGSGSVCGSGMAAREFSTLGYERENNPALQVSSREEYIERKVRENPHQPPYFKKMEQYNQQGPPDMDSLPRPDPLSADAFARAMEEGMLVLDVRSPEAFAGAFIPKSLAIPLELIPAYGGYFIPYDRDIGLVVNSSEDVARAVRYLIRLGYDRIAGYLAGGMSGWETSGRPYDRIASVHVNELVERFKKKADFTLLDVREESELKEEGTFADSMHVFLGDLPGQIDRIPRDKPVTTFCGSGMRAIIAASILKQHEFGRVEDNLGSMSACQAAGCPVAEVK